MGAAELPRPRLSRILKCFSKYLFKTTREIRGVVCHVTCRCMMRARREKYHGRSNKLAQCQVLIGFRIYDDQAYEYDSQDANLFIKNGTLWHKRPVLY